MDLGVIQVPRGKVTRKMKIETPACAIFGFTHQTTNKTGQHFVLKELDFTAHTHRESCKPVHVLKKAKTHGCVGTEVVCCVHKTSLKIG